MARLERLAAVSRLETAEVDERLYGSGIVDRCDRGELDAVDSVASGVTRSLLTSNDALLRDTLPLVLPAVHARIAIPLSVPPPGAPSRPRPPAPPR